MKLNLFNKFIVAFISVGLIPVLFISTYSAYLFQRETHFILEDNYKATAYYAARNLDSMIEKYNTISKLLYSYSAASSGIIRRTDGLGFAEILKSEAESESSKLKRSNDIVSFLHLIRNSDHHIANVIFLENQPETAGKIPYTMGYNNRPLVDPEKFFSLVRNENVRPNQLLIVPTHQDDYFQKRPADVFTIGRNYFDLSYPLGYEPVLGTLFMDIDTGAIDDIFNKLGLYTDNEILILDMDDNVIYSNGVTLKRYFEITEPCGPALWQVIIRIDYLRAIHNIANLIRLIYVIVIAVLFILLALSVLYSNVFTRPILAILRGMKQVEEGKFSINLQIKGQDEIRLLADGFMQMTSKLENYIRTSLLSKLRLREAELSALRARIKPHFLYNSLEIIRMNAIAHDDESTSNLSYHLAEFMHALLETDGNEVPLRHELDLLRNYLTFIDIRYEGRIAWTIDSGPALEEAKVLSLMIQPVVENAIIHGISPKGEGRVYISIAAENENLIIRVMDDGAGMDIKVIEKLNSILRAGYDESEMAHNGDSIGLKNVHDRLRSSYGDPYGISIESIPGKTVIAMLLPLRFFGGV